MKEKERVRTMQKFGSNKEKRDSASPAQSMAAAAAHQGSAFPAGGAGGGGGGAGANSDPFHNDWRRFECNTWHLEPTVRLISWAGSEIEPYGVDYILQRLGFSHARTTIPKWLQRGCMDPLDKALSILVLRTIQLVQKEKKTLQQEEQQQQQQQQGQHEKKKRLL